MSSEITEKNLIKKKYSIISRHYESLGNKLKDRLEKLLEKNHIPFITVKFRVKSFDSFDQKTKKFDNEDPFNRIDDICGLRIISYYYSDLFRISQLIKDEFDKQIMEFDPKIPSTDTELVKFGYRSWHYLIKFDEDWTRDIDYKAYYNYRVEIQIRTSIMDAWGSVEHELAYKKEIPISDSMKRRLARISALLEMVDEQFDHLREEKRQYLDSRTFKSRDNLEKLELTFDNFQILLDAFFPYRVSSINQSKKLYYEIREMMITQKEINMKDLVDLIENAKGILPILENDLRNIFLAQNKFTTNEERLLKIGPLRLYQAGALRNILSIFHDGYWEYQRVETHEIYANFIIKWRKNLRGRIT